MQLFQSSFRVEWISPTVSQGSARRATLGSVISSLQDGGPKTSKVQVQAYGLHYHLNGSERCSMMGET